MRHERAAYLIRLKAFFKWLKQKGSWRYFGKSHATGWRVILLQLSVKGQRLQPMSCHLTETFLNPDQWCTINHSVEQPANFTALQLVAKVHYFDLHPRCYLLQWCLGPKTKMWLFSIYFYHEVFSEIQVRIQLLDLPGLIVGLALG